MCGICNVWVCVCVGLVMCGCVYVWVCVCVGFVMCGCFGNMCTCIYCVFYCLYCVLVLCRLFIAAFRFVAQHLNHCATASEGFYVKESPLTPAGIEPATFRFVAQRLNHCGTAVSPPLSSTGVSQCYGR